jgi:hypothetical protein
MITELGDDDLRDQRLGRQPAGYSSEDGRLAVFSDL